MGGKVNTQDNKIIDRQHRFDAGDIPDLKVVVQRAVVSQNEQADEVSLNDWNADIPEYDAILIDFSSRGLKLSLPFSAQFEEVLQAKLEFQSLKYTFYCRINVRHIREEDGRWVVGCAIDPFIPDVLIDYLAEVSGKERRQHPRVRTNTVARIVRAGDTEGICGTLINLSEGGFCIEVDEPVEEDERVKLEFMSKGEKLESIAIRVCWQRRVDEGYHIGCSFADASAYKKLSGNVNIQPPELVIQRADKHTWYVIAMSVAAMLLPPFFTFGLEWWKAEYGEVAENNVAEVVEGETDELPQPKLVESDQALPSKFEQNDLAAKPDEGGVQETKPEIAWSSEQKPNIEDETPAMLNRDSQSKTLGSEAIVESGTADNATIDVATNTEPAVDPVEQKQPKQIASNVAVADEGPSSTTPTGESPASSDAVVSPRRNLETQPKHVAQTNPVPRDAEPELLAIHNVPPAEKVSGAELDFQPLKPIVWVFEEYPTLPVKPVSTGSSRRVAQLPVASKDIFATKPKEDEAMDEEPNPRNLLKDLLGGS